MLHAWHFLFRIGKQLCAIFFERSICNCFFFFFPSIFDPHYQVAFCSMAGRYSSGWQSTVWGALEKWETCSWVTDPESHTAEVLVKVAPRVAIGQIAEQAVIKNSVISLWLPKRELTIVWRRYLKSLPCMEELHKANLSRIKYLVMEMSFLLTVCCHVPTIFFSTQQS